MRRIRLRTAMIAMALLGVALGVGVGLRRRTDRLYALALRHGREASALETLLVEPNFGPQRTREVLERVHWNDAVADRFRAAAARPWFPFDPVPERVSCECGDHAARRAKAAAR